MRLSLPKCVCFQMPAARGAHQKIKSARPRSGVEHAIETLQGSAGCECQPCGMGRGLVRELETTFGCGVLGRSFDGEQMEVTVGRRCVAGGLISLFHSIHKRYPTKRETLHARSTVRSRGYIKTKPKGMGDSAAPACSMSREPKPNQAITLPRPFDYTSHQER
jgi:hypothetical protein